MLNFRCMAHGWSASVMAAVLSTGAFFHSDANAQDAKPEAAGKSVNEQMVDTLTQLSGGPHKGFRANHAKGLIVKGTFSPSASAASISAAPHLQKTSVPVTVRFSNSTGVPTMPDNDANSKPHGIAIRFQLPDAAFTDIVSISYNGFPAATPEEFLGLLNAIAQSGDDAAKPTPIEKFLEAHPQAKLFVTTPKPTPVSFATQAFYGVNSFKFTNAKNVSQFGRYQIVPVGGEKFLTTEQNAKASANYLMDELPGRLKKRPAKFRLLLQLPKEGDAIDNGSIAWPKDRQLVELGTMTLTSVVSDSLAAQQKLDFNPLELPDGIEASADPVLIARPGAYGHSIKRRHQ
ncbi:MAG: Catalase related subgroup [Polaromonas sp.]|nr:Catalase related subgroup [Polaromonas sp.]